MSGGPPGAEAPVSEALKRAVVAHYESRLEAFGATARGMDWKDEASQELRFALLAGITDLAGLDVAEVGCGAGHLLDFLERHGIAADYHGYDLSPAMVAAARSRHPEARFHELDLLRDPLPAHDVVLCSGLFHVKLAHSDAEWRAFLHAMLRAMYAASRVGIAFNVMTDQVDFRSPDLYYAPPGEILDFCRGELSRHVVLRHDYPLYEYTAYVYREPREG